MKEIFNLKSYLTFLSRNKVYTAINVFGLSVSLMFVILLVVFVQQEYTVDRQHRKLDRIYLFATQGGLAGEKDGGDVMGQTSRGFGPELLKRMPEIEQFCAVSYFPDSKLRLTDGRTLVYNSLYVEPTFYDVFDFELTVGDRTTVLNDPNHVVVSEDFARKLFGDATPMGRRIAMSDGTSCTVAGLFRTMGNTSVCPQPDIIRSNYYLVKNDESYNRYNNNLGQAQLFLLARPGADLLQRLPRLHGILKQICPTFFNSKNWQMEPCLLPLREVYLSNVDCEMGRRGDAAMVRIFGLVALIVLLFAVMNYINLTVAQSGYRAREMASRRLFGARRSEIVLKLIVESVSLCLLSLAIGLALALWLAPYVAHLLNAQLCIDRLLLPVNVVAVLGVVLLIGILAGVVPAVIQSRARPIEVVRGTFRKTTRMFFSRLFIVVQNVITISLMASALTIYLQIRHMVNAPLGYNRQGMMMIQNPVYWEDAGREKATAFATELKRLPCVEQVSVCNSSPVSVGLNGYHLDGKQHWVCEYEVDENWLPMLGIKVEQEYREGDDSLCYVNHALLNMLGFGPDVRDWLPHGDYSEGLKREPLKGIICDFHVGNINNSRFTDAAISVRVIRKLEMSTTWLVKVRGDEQEARQQVAAIYQRVFNDEWVPFMNRPYLDQWIVAAYEPQQRLLNVVSLFAVIAVIISLMGLIAMSAYFIQQRRKEIAVRKVFGSTGGQIRRKLVFTFLVYVLVAFVVAVPLVWHYMGDWLSAFNYRIQLWPWILAAGLFNLLISLAAVFIQSYLAGNENPVDAIKDNG